MSMDDIAIGHDGFTVLSNRERGKIAMVVESSRAEEVGNLRLKNLAIPAAHQNSQYGYERHLRHGF